MRRCTVPADILEDLEAIAAGGDCVGALLELWRHIEPRFDALETVDPRAYAIAPGVSARLIAAAPPADRSGFNLLWLNVGPSTREGVAS